MNFCIFSSPKRTCIRISEYLGKYVRISGVEWRAPVPNGDRTLLLPFLLACFRSVSLTARQRRWWCGARGTLSSSNGKYNYVYRTFSGYLRGFVKFVVKIRLQWNNERWNVYKLVRQAWLKQFTVLCTWASDGKYSGVGVGGMGSPEKDPPCLRPFIMSYIPLMVHSTLMKRFVEHVTTSHLHWWRRYYCINIWHWNQTKISQIFRPQKSKNSYVSCHAWGGASLESMAQGCFQDFLKSFLGSCVGRWALLQLQCSQAR